MGGGPIRPIRKAVVLSLGLGAAVANPSLASTRPPAPDHPLPPVVAPEPMHLGDVLEARQRAHHLRAVRRWHHRQAVRRARQRAAQVAAAQAAAVAASNADAWACISMREESGHNSIAGYFGFIYPPSTYIAPGPQVAAEYGNDWLAVPYSAQLLVAQALQRAYGWSPWSTAGACGLG